MKTGTGQCEISNKFLPLVSKINKFLPLANKESGCSLDLVVFGN